MNPIRKSTILQEVKERGIRKTMTIYLSAALTTIGVIKLFMEVYEIPPAIFPVTFTVLTVGGANAFLYAWHRGRPHTPRSRMWMFGLHSLFAVLAVVLSYQTVTSMRPFPSRITAGSVVAVLPFSNMSANADDEYFSDGITEDILTQLSKIADLRVISRTSVMQYKNTTKPIREIAGELGAGSILEGSVRRSGNRIRIVSQLIDAGTDGHLWSETYDREMTDVFAIQSDVARQIAAALRATLSPDEERLIEQKPTGDLDAYAYYLRGRDLYYRYTNDDNELAIEMFKNAIDIDPDYALAYAGLADAYGQRVQRFQYPEEWADSAMALSRKAIAINPDIAEPYKSLGMSLTSQNRYHEAIEQYSQAVRLNPNYSTAVTNLGLTNFWIGKPEKALPLLRRAITLSPERYTNYSHLGTVFEALGVDSLAEKYLRKSVEMQPSFIFPQIILAEKMAYRGNLKGAKRHIDSLLVVYPDDISLIVTLGELEVSAGNLNAAERHFRKVFELVPVESAPTTQLGYVLARKGKRKEAEELLAKSIQVGMDRVSAGSENYDTPLDLARAYSALGDTTEALRWLRNAINLGWVTVSDIESEPMFLPIRNTTGFRTTIEALRASIASRREELESQGEIF
jgi:TolB-like protein/Tfp pilus assembly protein PilF